MDILITIAIAAAGGLLAKKMKIPAGAMTGAMIALLFTGGEPNPEAQSLFCTAYGAIITYFFTKRSQSDGGEERSDG